MYDLSLGITMRSTIPANSYRHGLNFIPGIVKTRIDCYSGISNPSLIVMAPGLFPSDRRSPCGSLIVGNPAFDKALYILDHLRPRSGVPRNSRQGVRIQPFTS